MGGWVGEEWQGGGDVTIPNPPLSPNFTKVTSRDEKMVSFSHAIALPTGGYRSAALSNYMENSGMLFIASS